MYKFLKILLICFNNIDKICIILIEFFLYIFFYCVFSIWFIEYKYMRSGRVRELFFGRCFIFEVFS